jgi:cobalt-zinc-cadmium efflux system membrane fusion protein
MKLQRDHRFKLIALGIAIFVVLVLVAAGTYATVQNWLKNPSTNNDGAKQDPGKVELVYDKQGRPGVQVSPAVAEALLIKTTPAIKVTRPKALPGQLGQLAYDIDRLYPVRSIGNGLVTEVAMPGDASKNSLPNQRPLGFGDPVTKGQLLAVVRSPDLAEKKGNFVDSLLDLTVDREKLARLEGPYERGAIPETTYRDAIAKVQKDITAMARARRILELAKLKPAEIKALEDEAETIKKRFKKLAKAKSVDYKGAWDAEQVDRWARIEVKAPETGIIVEKNTNVGDIADPGKDPPLFRVADLTTLGVWIHPPEEYLPVLKKLLKERPPGELAVELKLQSDRSAPPIKGWLLRLAPSIDPNQRTPLLFGRIDNPDGKELLVGQLVLATILVPQETGLVEIPTTALNDVHGQSLVFVQARGFFRGKTKYIRRRVQVVNRFADKVQVRSAIHLTDREKARMKKDIENGLRPIEPLKPGEWVVTGGVVELTDGLDDLLAKARVEKK